MSARILRLPVTPRLFDGIFPVDGMPSYIYRFRVVPERAPNVHRIIDFDGRHSLRHVHLAIQRELRLDDDHLYSFFMSGSYWDGQTEVDGPIPGYGGGNVSSSRLFRLKLKPGSEFAYLFDYGMELRHRVQVVSITERTSPLEEPVLVEAVGAAPPQYPGEDEAPACDGVVDAAASRTSQRRVKAFRLKPMMAVGAEVTSLLIGLGQREDRQRFEELGSVALALVEQLQQHADHPEVRAVMSAHDWVHMLLDVSRLLSVRGHGDMALKLNTAANFLEPKAFLGDRMILLANAGRHAEARQHVEECLQIMGRDPWLLLTAGEAYRAMGDAEQSETFYRSSLESLPPGERDIAAGPLSELLFEQGRKAEAQALVIWELEGPFA